MINVVFDCQALLIQQYGGVSRYFYEIFSRIKHKAGFKVSLPIIYSDNYYFGDELNKVKKLRRGKYFLNRLNMKLFFMFHKKHIDILHPTYYSLEYLPKKYIINRNYKIIITVHDMIHELMMPELEHTIVDKRRMINIADGIITVSECTKNDLLKFYPKLNPNKIKVIYHGCCMDRFVSQKGDMEFPKQYILYVGSRANYKNFHILIEALPIVLSKFPQIRIVCAGGGPFSDDEREYMHQLGVEEKVIQCSMTDAQLSYAYKNAQCFVYPSRYEGFGIPILEAFYCECPIILTECSCFPEIAGDAALYFKEDDAGQLADCIVSVLTDSELANQLVQKGRERLKDFSWDKAADETIGFYREILNED